MKVNLGSGVGEGIKKGPDWLNIDVHPFPLTWDVQYLQWDLRRGLPTECDSMELVTSSHMLEHLTHVEARLLIERCFKCLKSGGIFHSGIPNFPRLLRAYLDGDWDYILPPMMHFASNGLWAEVMTYALFNSPDDPHKSFWDVEFALWLLKDIGFINVKIVPFNPELDVDSELRIRYTFYIAGEKP